MTGRLVALLALAATALPLVASAQTWTEGKNYFTIVPSLHTSVSAVTVPAAISPRN